MHPFSDTKGVMFGGNTIDETGVHAVDDLFVLTCSGNAIVS